MFNKNPAITRYGATARDTFSPTTGSSQGGVVPQYSSGYMPNYYPTPLSAGFSGGSIFPSASGLYDNVEQKFTNVSQAPTGVIDPKDYLTSALGNYQNVANQYSAGGFQPNLPTISLGTNYQGGQALQDALSGGIDYFGRLGMSEGLQNINAQTSAANQALQNSLGRTSGNQNLINVLQNQNLMKAQLAANPLVSEAQRGTLERSSAQINMNNQLQQLINSTLLQEGGYNTQNALAGYQAGLSGQQPLQNLLEALTALQGQYRGLDSTEGAIGQRNFK